MPTAWRRRWQRLKHDRRAALVAFLVIGVVLALLPFVTGELLGRSWVRILDFALLYIMLALGLTLSWATLACSISATSRSTRSRLPVCVARVAAFRAALAGVGHPANGCDAGAGFGVLLGAPTLKLRGDYLAIVTLGFGEIIRIFLTNLNTPINITNGPQGVSLIDPITISGLSLGETQSMLGVTLPSTYTYYYLFLGLTLAIVFISIRLQDSRIGRAWVAIREDEVAAAAMGINTRNVKLLAFAMGASFAGVSGGLFAGFQGFISPESFTLFESIIVLCMIVLGGMGNIAGVVLGALLITVFPEALRYLGDLQQLLIGRVLVDRTICVCWSSAGAVMVMIFRPAGLLPSVRRRREFSSDDSVLMQEQASLYDTRR